MKGAGLLPSPYADSPALGRWSAINRTLLSSVIAPLAIQRGRGRSLIDIDELDVELPRGFGRD